MAPDISLSTLQDAPSLAQPCIDVGVDFFWDDFQTDSGFLPSSLMDTGMGLSGLSFAAGESAWHRNGPDAARTSGRSLTSKLPSLEPESPQRENDEGLQDEEKELDAAGDINELDNLNTPLPGYAGLRPPMQTTANPWRLTAAGYTTVHTAVAPFRPVLPPEFVLPLRHALSRYIEGYFRGFHAHLPFLHWPTFSPDSRAPELVLALGAIGAMYRFEHARGYRLYTAAKAIITWRLAQMPGSSDVDHLQLAQARLLLMALASWGDGAVASEAIAMAGPIAMLCRDMGISDEDIESMSTDDDWLTWVRREERRRTLLAAYILFNLQSVAFNVPPLLVNQEVRVGLPSSEAEWTANSPQDWHRARLAPRARPQSFQRALETLASGTSIHKDGPVSAFANHALIHGLVQQLFWARNANSCLAEAPTSLPEPFVLRIETALRAWQASWEATSESSLDPSSPRGPLGFNSTAFLRIAYIRLNAGPGPGRSLFARDPEAIAQAFCGGDAPLTRSPRLDRAVLQCIHALSIPVRVGLPFVARTQTLSWSIQHALCNLECALLLTRWLRVVAQVARD
ncbi:hypothetical protein F5X68DRAFT_245156 [Plectosphaerella plurivora]|uniref:Xylanolytic transcriptional activator regulatory domain-containing protein n=1 Tax=Plectosphaerella plurivora TaxID=936078 RepID=A0A9P9A7Y5_9PEZI|nr:hypothetical protein F5X68DRAFT_245156 [Plectosphaerella plurivora]